MRAAVQWAPFQEKWAAEAMTAAVRYVGTADKQREQKTERREQRWQVSRPKQDRDRLVARVSIASHT